MQARRETDVRDQSRDKELPGLSDDGTEQEAPPHFNFEKKNNTIEESNL
jgi:hypothetical protein